MQPVADRVEDREMDDVLVDRVVERVATVVVRRLHHRGDDQAVAREGRGWQHRREQLRTQLHRSGPLHDVEGIAVHALRQDHLRRGMAVPLEQAHQALRQLDGAVDRHLGLQRPHPVGPVDDRHEGAQVSGLGPGRREDAGTGEGATRHRSLEVLVAGIRMSGARDRDESRLLEVDQVDDDAARAEGTLQLLGDHVTDPRRLRHVRAGQHALEEADAGLGVRVVHQAPTSSRSVGAHR